MSGNLFGPDKDFLRANLPIAEVARQLVAKYGCSGPHILADGTALCPFHDDANESFYLWDGDDGLQRWHCQPCGFGGDIYDLIMRSLSVNFPAALKEAGRMYASMPPSYTPPVQKSRERLQDFEGEWGQSITASRAFVATPDKHGIMAMMLKLVAPSEPAALALEWDAHLRERWGWGLEQSTNTIFMPHWDETGKLLGCKTRVGPNKGSLPGSQYSALYGSFLRGSGILREVLLTEGESDAVWADFQAIKLGRPLNVFSLPSGANKPPTPEQGAFLWGCSTVYLAFDPDEAGILATRMWIEFLAERGFPDIRVCSLPYGQDLRQARPDLNDLLARAKQPLPLPDNIRPTPNDLGWERQNSDGGWAPITNFVIEPTSRLVSTDESGLDVKLHMRRSTSETTIRWQELESTRAFNKWCNRFGLNFIGSETDRKAIVTFMEAQASILPEIFQTEQVGAHAAPEQYHFAGESVVYPSAYIGKLPWRYTPYNKSAADVTDRILLPLNGSGPSFEWGWLDAFLKLSEPAVTHPILAWVVAAARRHTVRDFPMLYVGGSSGVGKSTLARLAAKLGGSKIEVNLGAVTPFVLTKTLAATTNIPVFVDEWTLLSRHDTLEAFQGAIPLLYTGERAERGQADLSMVTYRMTAPTIIAGEQRLELDRELDRMVTVFPSRAAQNPYALSIIEQAPLEAFAWALHQYMLNARTIYPLENIAAASRPVYNQEVLNAGWRILTDFLHGAQDGGEDVPDIPAEPDLSCFERVAEERMGHNIYEDALAAGVAMRDKNGIPIVWLDEENRGTWVRQRELVGEISSRRLDLKLPGGSVAMLAYFAERHPVHKSQNVRPQGASSTLRATLIEGFLISPPVEADETPLTF